MPGVQGIPELPAEERHVALQCFGWIFERAYRQMQLKTLGCGSVWLSCGRKAGGDGTRATRPGSSTSASLGALKIIGCRAVEERSTSPQVFVYKGQLG